VSAGDTRSFTVFRVAVPLLLASGCDLVFALEPPGAVAVCGPYQEIGPQSFEDLVEVTDFSVDRTGNTGFVMSKRNGDVRLTPIVQTAENTWSIDLERMFNVDVLHDEQGVRIGRTSPAGDLFASQFAQEVGDLRVFRYELSRTNNVWAAEPLPVSPTVSADTMIAGGAVEINDGFGPDRFFRHVPILHETETLDRFVSIATSDPDARFDWFEATADGQLVTDAINRTQEVTQASLALGPNNKVVMAYAAIEGESSMLFLSEKIKARFPVGARLDELDGPGEEREPFLSEDCSTIYFRRGDAIIKARVELP
jgi:hypothetical protein